MKWHAELKEGVRVCRRGERGAYGRAIAMAVMSSRAFGGKCEGRPTGGKPREDDHTVRVGSGKGDEK